MGSGALVRYCSGTTEATVDTEAVISGDMSPSPSIISILSHVSTMTPFSRSEMALLDERYGPEWRHTATRWQILLLHHH